MSPGGGGVAVSPFVDAQGVWCPRNTASLRAVGTAAQTASDAPESPKAQIKHRRLPVAGLIGRLG